MTNTPVKILSLGSFNGRITECLEKIKTLNSKHGPFNAVLTVGDFFGDCKPEDPMVQDLLAEKLDVPCPTYFICGAKPLLENVLAKADKNNGEICANLTYLGQQGILTTSDGLKIAFLSGAYDHSTFFNTKVDEENSELPEASNPEPPATSAPHLYRLSDVNALQSSASGTSSSMKSSSGIDVLLTYEWPKSIARNSSIATNALSALESKDVGNLGVQCVAELAAVLQPRYHYAATPDSEGDESVDRRSIFFEREPYVNDGAAGRVPSSKVASYVTRFIGLGAQGTNLKSRWLHAMTLVPAMHATLDILQVRPANTTECPFVLTHQGPRGVKRPATGGNEEEGGNFFYRGDPVSGKRKGKGGENSHQGPPETYTCRICQTKGHWIQDCPDKKPESGDRGSQSGGPPEGYTCRICKNPGHWIQNCPDKTKSAPAPTEAECWFCLSSPNLSKHLIAAIGEEIYIALAKGPLVNPDPATAVVPGGGHVIIIPIGHYASWDQIPADTKESVQTELSKYKDALRRMYAKYDASMVVWELCRSGPRQMHHHIQAVPVPNSLLGKVKQTFIKEGSIAGMTFSESGGVKGGDFFRVDIGQGESLVHELGKGRMNLQFGRQVMARVLGEEERADWKKVSGNVEEEVKMTQEFKKAFEEFDV